MKPADPQNEMAAAVQLVDRGQWQSAQRAFEQILEALPENHDARCMLGLLYRQAGQLGRARSCFQQLVELAPDQAEGWFHLGEIQTAQKDFPAAEASLRQAIERAPRNAQYWQSLGVVFSRAGKHADAVTALKQAHRMQPESGALLVSLGNAQWALGQSVDAIQTYAHACRCDPKSHRAHYNLGIALADRGQPEAALEAFETATLLAPDGAATWYQLGNCLQRVGRMSDAAAAYQKAATRAPDHAAAWNNWMLALLESGRSHEALSIGRKAVRRHAEHAEIICNYSRILLACGHVQAAVDSARQAIGLDDQMAVAHNNLGRALAMQADAQSASAHCRRAVELAPDRPDIHSSLLFISHYAGQIDAAAHYQMHQQWESRFAGKPDRHSHRGRTRSARLRVGYVSPDFCAHPVASFIEPILQHHDRQRHHVFCYDDVSQPDAVNQRLQGHVETWRKTRHLSDAQLFKIITNDRIDILVDLAGHTAGNRLGLFAKKPAPIQVTYLGYPNTTGLRAIDYRITDQWADPEGQSDAFHSERLIRLQGGFLCYGPPEDSPGCGTPPVGRNGYITFGSFNNLAKISPQTLKMWVQVLDAVPHSRLFLKFRSLGDAGTCQAVKNKCIQAGIDFDRVILAGHCDSFKAHLRLYRQVDIALDTYPYGGTTTTCEALWMGVPVVTRAGRCHLSRVGYSLLCSLSCRKWAAFSSAQFVDIAVWLARHPETLQTLRQQLRAQMAASSLVAARPMAAQMEAAYEQMAARFFKACDKRYSPVSERLAHG